jgi:hypothetical protein
MPEDIEEAAHEPPANVSAEDQKTDMFTWRYWNIIRLYFM